MSRAIYFVIGAFVLAALGVNFLLENPVITDRKEKAAYYASINNPRAAEKCFIELLREDTANIDHHYNYIRAHYRIPKKEKKGKNDYIVRDDEGIREYYYNKTSSADSLQRDIGYYGWGLCRSMEGDYAFALQCFDSVRNRKLKHLNNSIGFALDETGQTARSEAYFLAEIGQEGHLEAAYGNLLHVLLKLRKSEALLALINNPAAAGFFSPYELRPVYFQLGQTGAYIRTIAAQIVESTNSPGFIGAALILLCWLLFLRRIDVFEKERWTYIMLTCVLGMICSAGTYPVTDALHQYLRFDLDGTITNDFLYAVLGIGAVEELVKFLPLGIMLIFTKEVNEPIDYIIYASISALGFAFIENLMYFGEGSLYSIHGRALTAVISHMFDASVVAYGLILCRYKRGGNIYLAFLIAFAVAALTHGFYDFWLINERVSAFSFITFLFMLGTMLCYNTFITNALNQSTYFEEQKVIDAGRLKDFLYCGLAAIVLLEYMIMAIRFGPDAGNLTLLRSMSSGAFLIFFLGSGLSHYPVKKGEWKPLIAKVGSRR